MFVWLLWWLCIQLILNGISRSSPRYAIFTRSTKANRNRRESRRQRRQRATADEGHWNNIYSNFITEFRIVICFPAFYFHNFIFLRTVVFRISVFFGKVVGFLSLLVVRRVDEHTKSRWIEYFHTEIEYSYDISISPTSARSLASTWKDFCSGSNTANKKAVGKTTDNDISRKRKSEHCKSLQMPAQWKNFTSPRSLCNFSLFCQKLEFSHLKSSAENFTLAWLLSW